MTQSRVEQARELTAELSDLLGQVLASVLVFGSVARDEVVHGVSDTNVLVLLERLDTGLLVRAAPLIQRWSRKEKAPPLVLSTGEWRRAADVFAIEVTDMQDAHLLLHGPDPVAALTVTPRELRLQAERELRGKLLQLREGLLLAAGNSAEVGRLLAGALPSFTAYMRSTLRLAGRPVPAATPAVIREAAGLLDADAAPMQAVWDARQAGRPPSPALDDPLVEGYYDFAERMADYVDGLEGI